MKKLSKAEKARRVPEAESRSHQVVHGEMYVAPALDKPNDYSRLDVFLRPYGICVTQWLAKTESPLSFFDGRSSILSPTMARRMAYALLNAANEFESASYAKQLADLDRDPPKKEFPHG